MVQYGNRSFKWAARSILAVSLLVFFLSAGHAIAPDNQMAKWTYRAAGDIYKLTTDKKTLFHQRPTTLLESTKSEKNSEKFYATPFQNIPCQQFRGKRVDYSAFVKGQDIEGKAGLWMKVKSGDRIVAFDNMDGHALNGNSRDWKKYSIVLDVPAEADTLSIGFYITGGGKLWLAEPDVAIAAKGATASQRVWDEKKHWQFVTELKKTPVNTDFTDSSSTLQDWVVFTSKSPSKVGVDRSEIYQNKPSGFIEQDEKNPGDFVLFFQDVSASNYLGKRVSLSGFVKTHDVTDWTALWMRVDSGQSVVAFDNMESRPIHGSTDWTKHSVVLDVPPNATRIRFGFMQAGSGKSWLNSSSLEIADKSVPLTVDLQSDRPAASESKQK